MKVRKGGTYIYDPVPIDRINALTNLKANDRVVVIHPAGCPPPNTMGHCHVARHDDPDRRLVGLVHCNSLSKKKK